MSKPKKVSKRKPTDSTMRNVRAANKRIEYLESSVRVLLLELGITQSRVTKLEQRNRRGK